MYVANSLVAIVNQCLEEVIFETLHDLIVHFKKTITG